LAAGRYPVSANNRVQKTAQVTSSHGGAPNAVLLGGHDRRLLPPQQCQLEAITGMLVGGTRVLEVQAPLVIHPSEIDGLDATCPLRQGQTSPQQGRLRLVGPGQGCIGLLLGRALAPGIPAAHNIFLQVNLTHGGPHAAVLGR